MRAAIARLVANEDLNFLLTNRLPRRLATGFMGWFSRIENPLIARSSIALWKLFSDVDLKDAAETQFPSMHACFIRTLKPGARPVVEDAELIASPSDAIVGAHGPIDGDVVQQLRNTGDFIAGMTDRFAIARHEELVGPVSLPASRF